MASLQHPTTIKDLPNDILSNILVRLLAKQLAQMRCVSKSLNAFLSESCFIKSHLRHSTQNNNDEILLVFSPISVYFDMEYEYTRFTAHPSRSPRLDVTDVIKLPVGHESLQRSFGSVIGSVDGLICFHQESPNGLIRIWNPSLSAVLTLPKPPYIMPSHSDFDWIKVFYGFGFDPQTDDYKVVKLTNIPVRLFRDRLFCDDREWGQVDVYSMKKGSWHSITERPPSHVKSFYEQATVCVDTHDGYFHWIGYIGKDRKAHTIVACDLGFETFREIPIPDGIQPHVRRCYKIGVKAEKLCFMSRVGDDECEVWVMDEYGVAESWVKHHVFSDFIGIIPYGFTSHDEFLFQTVFHGLAMFDPVEAKCKKFKINVELDGDGRTKVVEYVDSLVWVAPPKLQI